MTATLKRGVAGAVLGFLCVRTVESFAPGLSFLALVGITIPLTIAVIALCDSWGFNVEDR